MSMQNKQRKMMCEGSCERHKGTVKQYRVFDPKAHHDWGNFYYCEEAVKEDISRGLEVYRVK